MEKNSEVSKASTKKKRSPLVFVVLLLGLAVIVALVVVLAFNFFSTNAQQSIVTIESATQQSGGVSTTNYLPILADHINWENLSDKEREDIARYAVAEATKRAEAEYVNYFNVLGQSSGERKTLFLFTHGAEHITIFVNDDYVLLPYKG
ncbi:MAG: hypothetical protein FWE96_03795 [Coriobacteriia bacterium]|nr:hypothetical protein [Coriobacteriia bacterium]